MRDHPKVSQAVNVVILDGNKVLLHKRRNTGWRDGWYDLPGGHLEQGENFQQTGAREVKEETSITVEPRDLKLFHICQNMTETPYTYLNFRALKWSGKPVTMDSQHVEDLKFFPLSDLPDKTINYVKHAIANLSSPEITFAYMSAEDNDQ